MNSKLRVAVVGAGLIGARRGRIAHAHPRSEVVLVADPDVGRAEALAEEFGCRWSTRWPDDRPGEAIDACIVATPHKYLSPLTVAALRRGCHVLCEKPLGRNAEEAHTAVETTRVTGRVLKIGFNLRHHAAISEAHRLARAGAIGPLLFMRCRYGHGGRPGYEKEWRADPELAGGGELVDQGIHALDLFRWFMGEFTEVRAFLSTAYWDVAPLEDNVFALLRTDAGQVAMLHASWTQWRNLFSLEVFGRDGYLIIEGLGGSYGPETLRIGHRAQSGHRPAEDLIPLPLDHDPWQAEWDEFVAAAAEHREPLASGADAYQALLLAAAIYRSGSLNAAG